MTRQIRFGKKVRVESTFQIKHRFLLWWLKHQEVKQMADASAALARKNSDPMHIHEAFH